MGQEDRTTPDRLQTVTDVYRTDEVARRMGVNEAVVRRTLNARREGDRSSLAEGLPAVRVCGRWLVPKQQFDALFGLPRAPGRR